MGSINFIDQITELKRLNSNKSLDTITGKGSMMPFNNTCSGARKLMHSVQVEHRLDLLYPEPPLVSTGYENRYGEKSSSFIRADANYYVVAKVCKYSKSPNHDYILFIRREDGVYDMIERKAYKHITESCGFLYNNKKIDSYEPGTMIYKDDVVKKSLSYDDDNNKADGINLNSIYLSNEYTKEDSFIISELASHKLAAPIIKTPRVVLNTNDIPLNLYGNDDNYKTIPEIGEMVENQVLIGYRREAKDEAFFSQSIKNLQRLMISDKKHTMEGQLVDINIYCNNPAIFDSIYYQQLKVYYEDQQRYYREIIAIIDEIKGKNGVLSYELKKLYYNISKILNNGQYINDKTKVFSNIIIDFVVISKAAAEVGDKISNRHGGKGCISLILPDDKMPITKSGVRAEIIINSSTCINRENVGQLFEVSTNFMSQTLLEFMNSGVLHFEEAMEYYKQYLSYVIPCQAKAFEEYFDNLEVDDQQFFFEHLMNDIGIYISMRPITESIDIDRMKFIYDKFTFMKQYEVIVPQKCSNGNIRYITARRPLIIAKQYFYRLKQHAEDKFSVVSLSATNIRNENSRNNSKKNYESIYAKTPVRFGEMETGNLGHLGMETVVTALMLYSSSPHGRRLSEQLLTGDPFTIDIKLDDQSKNRSVEILNAYLTTMGLELAFIKKPKKGKKAIKKIPIRKTIVGIEHSGLKTAIWHCNPKQQLSEAYLESIYGAKNDTELKKAISKFAIRKVR